MSNRIFATIGAHAEETSREIETPASLVDAIQGNMCNVRMWVETLAYPETEDRRAEYDYEELTSEWYDAAEDFGEAETAEEFADRLFREAQQD